MRQKNELDDIEVSINAKILNGEDSEDIISDQDQTSLYSDRSSDLRGKGGPSALDLEDEPAEFARGEIDVKTQMDRVARIARANANHHYDLDETPESTMGGLDEVISRTERDLHLRPRKTEDSLEETAEDFELKSSSPPEGATLLKVEDIEAEFDLESEKLDVGEMNEQDAKEAGYIDENDRPL